eukprot:TRINITY_DN50_c0_g1_i1.p1 TRINITY_DN50_c0_g1~~TRINITY_DN50_c0_g1_i1.p1  ORF type:complete len:158 (-),score=80.17 TRINITY_DN50_c0_g1_i1:273-746(-)
MSKLFVGGLSRDTTTEGLTEAFQQHGETVAVRIMFDRDTNQSRGFGFVEFVEESHAKEAAKALDGSELDGRTIRVDFAGDKKAGSGGSDRGGRGGFRGGRGGGGDRGGFRGGRGGFGGDRDGGRDGGFRGGRGGGDRGGRGGFRGGRGGRSSSPSRN